MAGTFEVYEDAGGQRRFRRTAAIGQAIAAAEARTSKVAALRGIESVRTNAPDTAFDLSE